MEHVKDIVRSIVGPTHVTERTLFWCTFQKWSTRCRFLCRHFIVIVALYHHRIV